VIVVVTGGSGCLGHAVIDQLLEPGGVLGPVEVRSLDRRRSGRPPREGLVELLGDIRSARSLREAVRGADLVLHCAAAVDWGQAPASELEEINVQGTERLIEACRAEGVRALVHTSTLDVLFTGEPIRDADESRPYPERHPNAYCRTKADAEQRALDANGPSLRTAVVRPCVIFGERDPFHVPALLSRARRGRLLRIGDGRARSQFSYVGNVAHALLLAGRSLLGEGRAAGRVYFVTDGEPENFFEFLAPFVVAGGGRMPPRALSLPHAPLHAVGALLEGLARVVQPLVSYRPVLTRFAVDFVCVDYTVKTDRAARELGYAPRFVRAEAIARTIAWQAATRT
jgi:sterol-4alpha-carboxylate 3-dehydrogenase (decarboxylating)